MEQVILVKKVKSKKWKVKRRVRAYRTDMTLPAPQALDMPAIVVPVVNFDNNQHSHNEHLRLQNLWDAVTTFAAVLQM